MVWEVVDNAIDSTGGFYSIVVRVHSDNSVSCRTDEYPVDTQGHGPSGGGHHV